MFLAPSKFLCLRCFYCDIFLVILSEKVIGHVMYPMLTANSSQTGGVVLWLSSQRLVALKSWKVHTCLLVVVVCVCGVLTFISDNFYHATPC